MATRNKHKGPRALLAALLALAMATAGAPCALAVPEDEILPSPAMQEEQDADDALPSPVMQANQAIVRPGDDITFCVYVPLDDMQDLGQLQVSDELPTQVTPVKVVVRDANGEDVTEQAGTALVDGQKAGFTFDPEWLEGAVPQGGMLTIAVSAQVDQDDESASALANTATVTYDDRETQTNTVTVAVAPVSQDTARASSALSLMAASEPQTFQTQSVSTGMLFSGGYYLESAGDVPVSLNAADITVHNGGLEPSPEGAFVVRDYTPSANDGGKNFWVSALYRNYGDLVNSTTGERIAVDVKTTIVPKATCATPAAYEWNIIVGEQYSRDYAYVIFYTPGMGMKVANMPVFDQTWEFFKAGTNEPACVDDELWIMQQSLDLGEGFASRNVTASYVTSSMPNRNNQAGNQDDIAKIASGSLRSVVPGSNVYEFAQTNWAGESDGTWRGLIGATVFTELANGGSFRWVEPGEDDTSQDLSSQGLGAYLNTHLWASGSLKVAMNGSNELTIRNLQVGTNDWPRSNPGSLDSQGLEYDRANGRYQDSDDPVCYGMKYFVTYFTTLTGFVPHDPVKSVDKQTAYAGDTITYAVEQPIGKWGSDLAQDTTYELFQFTDTLPAGTTYAPNSFRAFDTAGADVTDKGSFSVTGQDLSFAFSESYLTDGLKYDGGNVRFVFKATVDEGAAEGTELTNEAVDYINGYDLKSNPVKTTILEDEYYAPVKAVDKAEAKVGETITYTVTQKIHALADQPGGAAYSAMTFADTIPTGLTYKPGSFSIVDAGEVSITNEDSCANAYGAQRAGRLTVAGQKLAYAFDADYLSAMPYNGKDMTFTFKATVDEGAEGTTLKNTAATTVNANEEMSNEVVTVVPEKPVIPPPTAPTKQVDKQKAHPGDSLAYTVTQPVGELPEGYFYTKLTFRDELPDGAAPTALKVLGVDGADVTAAAGTTGIAGQVVTYTFKEEWLQQTLGNASGTLTFCIDAKIDDGNPARYGNRLVNDATLDFGGDTVLRTNKVVTVVEVDPVALPLTGLSGIAGIIAAAGAAVALGLVGLTLTRSKARRGTR